MKVMTPMLKRLKGSYGPVLELFVSHMASMSVSRCYKETQKGNEGRGRKGSRKLRGTRRKQSRPVFFFWMIHHQLLMDLRKV
jgi:hypothetical protein